MLRLGGDAERVAQSDTSGYGTIRSLHQPDTVHCWGDFTRGIRRDKHSRQVSGLHVIRRVAAIGWVLVAKPTSRYLTPFFKSK
jgi:hypothetical protein